VPELRKVVDMFKKIGATCRKVRGKNIYECWKGYARATISEKGIVVGSSGEFRIEYSRFETREEGISDDRFLSMLKEATGADSVELVIPCDTAELRLEFSLDKARRAVEVFNTLAEKDMYVVLTNIEGELRLIKEGMATSVDEWLREFE